MEARTLHGLGGGSELALFSKDATDLDPAKAAAKGKVERIEIAGAWVRPAAGSKAPLGGGYAVETLSVQSPLKMRVAAAAGLKSKLSKPVDDLGFSLVDDPKTMVASRGAEAPP